MLFRCIAWLLLAIFGAFALQAAAKGRPLSLPKEKFLPPPFSFVSVEAECTGSPITPSPVDLQTPAARMIRFQSTDGEQVMTLDAASNSPLEGGRLYNSGVHTKFSVQASKALAADWSVIEMKALIMTSTNNDPYGSQDLEPLPEPIPVTARFDFNEGIVDFSFDEKSRRKIGCPIIRFKGLFNLKVVPEDKPTMFLPEADRA